MAIGTLFSPQGNDSYQSSFSGLDPAALKQWETLFSGAQQGIAPWQQAGFNQAIKQAGTQFSALDAAKGGQNPFTGAQIASSAAQYVLPQFAQLNSQMLGDLLGQRQISRGSGESHSRGSGMGYNAVNSFTDNLAKWAAPGGFGAGAKCWVAQELYGHTDERINLIKDYLNEQLETDTAIGQFARWYGVNGPEIAESLSNGLRSRPFWMKVFRMLTQQAHAATRLIIPVSIGV